MESKIKPTRVAILGAGPGGLFMYKRLVETSGENFEIEIFEAKHQLGAGMPYSHAGANDEHITNVSDNEIPDLVTSIEEWIETVPQETLDRFKIDRKQFNEYKVLPRLLFGKYLSAQFDLLQKKAKKKGIVTKIHLETIVADIIDDAETDQVRVVTNKSESQEFDCVVICTGHKWPVEHEGKVPGYFDSPYPPSKLDLKLNHAVAIKGSSLTAIDAIRTMARSNGSFEKRTDGKTYFIPHQDSPEFRMVMHSRNGLLPAVRFHLEEPLLSTDSLLTPEQVRENIAENDGFLSLDFVFEKDFKELFIEKDPAFYDRIKDMTIEDFVNSMMNLRESIEPFQLFRAEYKEAEESIKREESVYWKEMLAVLSFAMNYPAKYLSAEDMQRLKKVLMPLISIVIAFVPQSSCEELLALNDAGKLDILTVGDDSSVDTEPQGGATYHYKDEEGHPQSVYFKTFVDCVGQPHLAYDAFPFKNLLMGGNISPARLAFRSAEAGASDFAKGGKDVEKGKNGEYYLKVPGITITDSFQIVDQQGKASNRIFIMAVPYIGGFNPDYSGLDFCEKASESIVQRLVQSNLSLV
jgi:hypothetical protein